MAVRRRASEKEKWETPYRRKVDGVSHKRLSEGGGKRGTEKISRCARNDSVGDGYPVHHTKNVWEKHISRIVIGSGAEGSFSLAVRRRASDGEKWETPYRGKADGVSRKRLSEGGGKRGTEKISRCARNDSVGDGYPVHHTKNVWEKHVSRIVIGSGAEGSFSLMVRRSVSDSEERETPYRGKWKRRVSRIVIPSEVEGFFSLAVRRSVFDSEERETPCRGKADGAFRKRLSEGGEKKGTKKISRCARNDSVGDGYPVHHTKNVWKKHVSRIVIGSGAEGSFSLTVRRSVFDSEKWETPYHGKAVCHGNKKRGGIPLFLYFDGSASSSLSSPTVSAIASASWAASSSRLP